MSEPVALPLAVPHDADEPTEVVLIDICARPQCRREFEHGNVRGRRRDYCSETCRRLADRDYKRAKATAEHFERLAERSRADVRAFGRAGDETTSTAELSPDVARERISSAVARSRAVLRFADGADPRLVNELQALCDAVEPAVVFVR